MYKFCGQNITEVVVNEGGIKYSKLFAITGTYILCRHT